MTNIAKISQVLIYWVKEEIEAGFRVSSLERKTFTLKHEYFESYLARHDFIGYDEYEEVYYDDFVKALSEFDRDQLIDECVKETLK